MVSVIIPVHDSAAHLRECLDSVLAQTLRDIEVICVDDRSVDESPAILREYAERDDRLTVLANLGEGPGAARNTGLDVARGEYLSFLDADDYFDHRMLEMMAAKARADDAELCICRARYHNMATGRFEPAEGLTRRDLIPATPFSPRDIPEHILIVSSPATWTKLFRRDFVRRLDLRHQDVRRSSDLLFTKLATVKAQRITFVDKVLVTYRTGTDTNMQSRNDEVPFEYHKALTALRDALVESGVYPQVERGFVSLALTSSLYNLHSLRTHAAYSALYDRLRTEYFDALKITGRESDYFFSAREARQAEAIMRSSSDEYLLSQSRLLRDELRTTRDQLKRVKGRLDRIEGSRWHRLGKQLRSLTARLRRKRPPA